VYETVERGARSYQPLHNRSKDDDIFAYVTHSKSGTRQYRVKDLPEGLFISYT